MTISWFSVPRGALRQADAGTATHVPRAAWSANRLNSAVLRVQRGLAKALCSRNVRELCKLGFRKVHAFPGKAVTGREGAESSAFLGVSRLRRIATVCRVTLP
jgi:hypothetical protein